MNMWSTGLKDLYDKVQYDGLWIDMNEPTTFNHGELDHSKVKTSTQTPRCKISLINPWSCNQLIMTTIGIISSNKTSQAHLNFLSYQDMTQILTALTLISQTMRLHDSLS